MQEIFINCNVYTCTNHIIIFYSIISSETPKNVQILNNNEYSDKSVVPIINDNPAQKSNDGSINVNINVFYHLNHLL